MATPDRETYTTDPNRAIYTRESSGTGWFVGIIVVLALLAIGYLVFSANSGTAPTVDTTTTTTAPAPAIEAPADPTLAPAPMTQAPATEPAPVTTAPATEAPAPATAPETTPAPETPAAVPGA